MFFDFAVDFVSRDVNKALHAHLLRTFEKDMCAVDIVVSEAV